MMRLMTMTLVLAILASGAVAGEQKFALNGDNTKIAWIGTKPLGKHIGGFKNLTGSAVLADATGLKLDVEIDCGSLFSDNDKLTNHLKSPDFFGVKDNPKAKFVSKKVEKSDKGFVITGDLTLLGKTKEITFPATVEVGDALRLSATFKIKRTDFGMNYGKGKIDDQVSLQVTVNAKK